MIGLSFPNVVGLAAGFDKDGLAVRGLGAVVALYLVGVVVYFGFLGVAKFRASSVQSKVSTLDLSYTNALQLKARYEVLKDRQELKFAALDCWKLDAATQPEGIALDGFNFKDGRILTLNGTAPQDAGTSVIDYYNAMRKATLNGKPAFKTDGQDTFTTRNLATGVATWSFSLELKRTELQ